MNYVRHKITRKIYLVVEILISGHIAVMGDDNYIIILNPNNVEYLTSFEVAIEELFNETIFSG